MNVALRMTPTFASVAVRVLHVMPEDVDLFRLTQFIHAYHKFVEDEGTDRYGNPPQFTYIVRPNLKIIVGGYTV